MKPNPFASLNHFTVPVMRAMEPCSEKEVLLRPYHLTSSRNYAAPAAGPAT
jgi:hypothetical protein